MKKALFAALTIGAAATATVVARRARRVGGLRLDRGLAALQLALRGGARYAGNAPRLFMLAGENRQQLRNDLALQTAEDVASTLGAMKGVLMKLGQMASYVDDSLPPEARRTLGRLPACELGSLVSLNGHGGHLHRGCVSASRIFDECPGSAQQGIACRSRKLPVSGM